MFRVFSGTLCLALVYMICVTANAGATGSTAQGDLGLQVEERANGEFHISDSLVRDLSCSSLQRDNVLSSLQPEAFARYRELPIQNYGGGQCFGFALVQRDLFYLARFNARESDSIAKEELNYILDVLGETKMQKVPCSGRGCGNEPQEVLVNVPKHPFTLPYSAFASNAFRESLKKKIEKRQFVANVFNLSNLFTNIFMLPSIEREKPDEGKEKTMKEILSELSRGRLPILAINFDAGEHAVVALSAEKVGDDAYDIHIYDSNQPGWDSMIRYKKGLFAPSSYYYNYPGLLRADHHIGVRVEEDDEMDALQEAEYEYYANICISLKSVYAASHLMDRKGQVEKNAVAEFSRSRKSPAASSAQSWTSFSAMARTAR